MAILIYIFQFFFISALFQTTAEDFPEINNLQKNGEIEIYNPDDLYNYINGAADLYLNYNFVELKLQRYKGNAEQSLTIEIYRHSNNLTAFGIYSSERPSEGNWVDIGAQGYYEGEILNFYKGQYYIKIMAYKIENAEDFLKNTAKIVDENLEGENELPILLKSFPEKGKIEHSEKYIHKNFLGYESLSGAFTADYIIDGENFTMFLIQKNSNKKCKKMLIEYFDSIKLDKENVKEGEMLVKDPYLGEININWYNSYVFGTIYFSNIKTSEKYLEYMNKNLNPK